MPAERAKAMGVFGFVMAGGGSLGVLLGGILTDTLDWHWIFLVNVPIGVAVIVLSLRLVPASRPAGAGGKLDVAGAVTVTSALMLAVYAIVNGNDVGLDLGADARDARRLRRAVRRVRRPRGARRRCRSCRSGCSSSGTSRPRTSSGVFWAAAMFACVLHLGPLPAARARLQPAAGRARVPPVEPDHGRLLARPLGEARDALRHQAAARRPGCLLAAIGLALLARAPVGGRRPRST